MSPLARMRERLATLAARARVAPAVFRLQFRRRRLAKRYLKGDGLEIGALHYPLWVPSGVRVRYVDRMGVADLHGHYPELPVHKLVPVDVIDDGEKLSSQPDSSADFVIANHFIEHTEDPLDTLASHLRVLRPGGVIFMAVPDRRRTFDERRAPTSLEHIVQDHVEGAARSRREHQEEWASLVENVSEGEVQRRVRELEQEDYSIHFHVWAPWEFRVLLEYAREEGGLPFDIEALQGNEHEFIAILRRI